MRTTESGEGINGDITDEYSAMPDLDSLMLQASAESFKKMVVAPFASISLIGKFIGRGFHKFNNVLQNHLIRKTTYDLEYQYEESLKVQDERLL